jgi:hypothetical protein
MALAKELTVVTVEFFDPVPHALRHDVSWIT